VEGYATKMSGRDFADHDSKEYAVFTGKKSGRRYVGVMINLSFGGFRFSEKAMKMYCKIKKISYREREEIERTDPVMISVVQELGTTCASGGSAELKVMLVPWELRKHYEIPEYDGSEGLDLDLKGYKLEAIKNMITDEEPENMEKFKADVLEIIEDTYWEDWEAKGLDEMDLAASGLYY